MLFRTRQRRAPGTLARLAATGLALCLAWSGRTAQTTPADTSADDDDPIAAIRLEGLRRSQVMDTLSYMTDVIGPRLTGSPALKRANEWARDKFACWGLTNAHLEAWGPFGRGWTLKRFSAQIIEPQDIPLLACPAAWSPGFKEPLVAEVVYLDLQTNTDLERYAGKLKGAIVLSGRPREVGPVFDATAVRIAETNLLTLANSGVGEGMRYSMNLASRRPGQRGAPPSRFMGNPFRTLSFLAKEGAALVVSPSPLGEEGTLMVMAASVPPPDTGRSNVFAGFFGGARVWATNAPTIPAQMTLAIEHYNRLVRMITNGVKLKMQVDLQVQFNDDDLMAYNTIAEIPGSDKKDEIVMLGAHLDSWQAGTGATDNGAGSAAVMEAARILSTLKLHPRRTIRFALWTGEEEGLMGSRAYVAGHFAYYTNAVGTNATPARTTTNEVARAELRSSRAIEAGPIIANESLRSLVRPRGTNGTGFARGGGRSGAAGGSAARRLVRLPEYDRLCAYFNLDNGAGKIRGIFMQGNEALRPLFREWLEPFRDLGAETITLANTGSTDHVSFDDVGLPGFEFLQDPLDYGTRTHHTNQDVFDRVLPDDLKQAATILAAFVYDAAMAEAKLPRKPFREGGPAGFLPY